MDLLKLFTNRTSQTERLIKAQQLGHEIDKRLPEKYRIKSSYRDLMRGDTYEILQTHPDVQKLADAMYQQTSEDINNEADDKTRKISDRSFGISFDTDRSIRKRLRTIALNSLAMYHQQKFGTSLGQLEDKLNSTTNNSEAFNISSILIKDKLEQVLNTVKPGFISTENVEISLAEKLISGMKVQFGVEMACLKLVCEKLLKSAFKFDSVGKFMDTLKKAVENNIKIITGLATMNIRWEPTVYGTIGSNTDPEDPYYKFKHKYFTLNQEGEYSTNLTIAPKQSLVEDVVKILKKVLPKLELQPTWGCPALKMHVETPEGKKNMIELTHDWFCNRFEETIYPWIEKSLAPKYVKGARVRL